jgi:hypothetical protein
LNMKNPLSDGLAIGLLLIAVTALSITVWSQQAIAQSAPDVYYNTFEYADMRSTFSWVPNYWAGSGPVALGAGELSGQVSGVYTGSANLGDNNTATMPVYVNDPSVCRGNWCLRYDETTSTGGGGPLYYLTLGNRLPNQTTSHLFYRQSLKFPAGYQFIFGKINYVRDFDAGAVTVIVVKNCSGVCRASTGLNIEVTNPSANYSCNKGPCTLTDDNTWHSYEVEIDPNGGGANAATLRMWIDDNLVLEYCSSCTSHATIAGAVNPGGIGFGQYDNPPGNGGGSPSQNQHFWIDDLAVSRQRIGAGTSSAVSPPASPTNLGLR